MQLKDVQQVLAQATDKPSSALEAVKQLQTLVERASHSLEEGNTLQAQALLEQGFTTLMGAFHYLNINLENLVQREKTRQKKESLFNTDRVILVFSDHAELRVSGELRGTIPLYSLDDYQELRQIAQLFNCRVEQADHLQLDLFTLLSQPSPSPHANTPE